MTRLAPIELVDLEAYEGRVIATLAPRAGALQVSPGEPGRVAVLFVQNGRVEELRFVASRDEALNTAAAPPRPRWAGVPTRMTRLAAVLPVRDLDRALEHYRALGFAVRAYAGGGYGFGEHDGLNVHRPGR